MRMLKCFTMRAKVLRAPFPRKKKMEGFCLSENSRLVSRDVSRAKSVNSDTVRCPLSYQPRLITPVRECRATKCTSETHLNRKLLDDTARRRFGRVVEHLVDPLVDDLGRHARSEDDGTLLEAGFDPQVGGGLSASELAPDVDVVWLSAMTLDVCCRGSSRLPAGSSCPFLPLTGIPFASDIASCHVTPLART